MIEENLRDVWQRIEAAARKSGRTPGSVQMVAVSKTVPVERIKAAIDAGATVFGENYIQESREKIEALAAHQISWHFIGHLQSNKAKYAVRLFDLIHSVDSLKLAREIDKHARKLGKIQNVLAQVNIAEEASKSGVSEDQAPQLVREIGQLENLSLKGLMTMPPYFNAPDKVRPFFRALRELSQRIDAMNIAGGPLAELSMGMTGDFEAAIEEGATLVRIGTAIFGERA